MSNFPQSGRRPVELDYGVSADTAVLTRFFNAVYAWMAAGLATTAVVAWYVSTQLDLVHMLHGPLLWILCIAQLVLVFTISAAIQRINATVATALFILYAALNGVTLSVIFLIYAHATLASAFVVTGGTFAVMSIYGMVTKTDLTRLGSILFMALIGLVIAMVVNIFLHSSALQWIASIVGVLIFVGLTAYDTQKLKSIALQTRDNSDIASRLAINGALMLYLDFLNLFLFILQLMNGNNRR